MFSFGFQ